MKTRSPAVEDESGDANRRDEQQCEHESYDESSFAAGFWNITVLIFCSQATIAVQRPSLNELSDSNNLLANDENLC